MLACRCRLIRCVRALLQAIALFDKSEAWELAVELCGSLRAYYENIVYDYKSLAQILVRRRRRQRVGFNFAGCAARSSGILRED